VVELAAAAGGVLGQVLRLDGGEQERLAVALEDVGEEVLQPLHAAEGGLRLGVVLALLRPPQAEGAVDGRVVARLARLEALQLFDALGFGPRRRARSA
jgi:hypothetical protein